MSDFTMVSPLLDGYTVEKPVMSQRDRIWYSVRHDDSGENFVLKHISLPASDAQVRALILSGIYKSEADVMAYYTGVVSDIRRELDVGKKLAQTGCFAGPVDYQIVQKKDSIGYDIYILQELQVPLNELIDRNGMTHLRAVNLGIDICDAIIACREAGYLFANLKPENIFLIPSGKFLLGDLGLISLTDLEYAGIPESYIDSFSAPELFDITTAPNTTIDLYSLGMVLYRIYNGNHGPFEDENTNGPMADKLRLSGKPLPTPIYADYELAAIITKACAFRIQSRYSSPEKLKDALVQYLERNQIPDSLVVPPLVVDPEPIVAEEEEIDLPQEEPLRMVDAEELDAAFRASFAPSSEHIGTDTIELSLADISEEPSRKDSTLSLGISSTLEENEPEPVLVVNLPTEPQKPSVAPEVSATAVRPQATVAVDTDSMPTEAADTPSAEQAPTDPAVIPTESTPSVPEEKLPEPTPSASAPLTINTVSGPKMPTGNLKMKKKGRHSKRRENLVVEIPLDPTEEADHHRDDASSVAITMPEANTEPVADIVDTISPDPISESVPVSEDRGSAPSMEPVADRPGVEADLKDSIEDIDALIASVNEVVGSHDADDSHTTKDSGENSALTMHVAPIDSEYFTPEQEERHEHRSSHHEEDAPKSKWLPLTVIAILTVALIGVIAFLLNNYYVNITTLELIDHSTEDLTVELVTPDAQESFIVTCTDNYGNAYPRAVNGNRYTFTGLRENTAYTVTVVASEYHRLRSGKAYTITVKTPGTTKITDFSARRGTQAGDVVLNISSEGPAPEEWQYTYTDSTGVVSGPFPFANQTALVTNLKEGTTYTFEIQAPHDLYLSGETTVEYTLLPIVTIHSLHITDVFDTSVSIAWDYKDNAPQEWVVTCEGGDFSKSVTTSDLNVTFADLPDFKREYTFTVSALGADEPAVLTLPADPIILEDLKAEYNENGTVTITWNTPAGSPENGWHLTYNTVGSFHVPYFVRDIKEDSVVLENLIPNTQYQFTLYLTTEDASKALFGETSTTLETPAAEAFADYDIDPNPVYGRDASNVSLWLCPDKEDWTYMDLENLRHSFTKDEKIAVCIQVESISASEDTVDLLYVIRNENGQVVVDETQEFTWDSLWFERRHANAIPLPKKESESTSTPGNYTLEIYINGMLLVQKDFTIA